MAVASLLASVVTIANSTISGTVATPTMATAAASSATLTITNSTVSATWRYLRRRMRRHSRNRKHNPERECVRKHRWHCHFARLQHQQRRRRRSFKRSRRSDQHRPAAWSVAESRWTNAHAWRWGGPAIDAGDPSFAPPPEHDQRGACFYRVFGGRIDVGSVETQPRPRCVTPAPRPGPHQTE